VGQYFPTLINGGAPLCSSQRLKVRCDEALSNFAFNFELRRYAMATGWTARRAARSLGSARPSATSSRMTSR